MKLTKELILETIRPVNDPDLGMSLVDMGLIYDIKIGKKGKIKIKMTLTSPACPIGDILISQIRSEILLLDGVTDVDIEMVWDPPWNPEEMATDEVKDALGIW